MSVLLQRAEALRNVLKHSPESTDLTEVRDVLGALQGALTDVAVLRQYTHLDIYGRDDGLHDLTLTVTLERGELELLIAWLFGLDE